MRAVRQAARYEEGKERNWATLTVPLAFHVVGTDFDLPITRSIIEDQINRLNDDFAGAYIPESDLRDVNDQFLDRATDTRINFCYATAKKSTAPIINFLTVAEDELTDLDSLRSNSGAAPAVDPNRHVNIWIVPDRSITTGFAQYPGGVRELDGIVVGRTYFGVGVHNDERFDQGRTLTHLMGNYLGLRPLWGGEVPCGDDGVTDTPLHNAPNVGRPRPYHYSTCGDTLLEMTMNFMDNTHDDQMYLFTQGQARLMRAMLSGKGPRKGLLKTPTRCNLVEERSLSHEQFANSKYEKNKGLVEEAVSVAPNPATRILTITMTLTGEETIAGSYTLKIVDLWGRTMYERVALPSQVGTVTVPVADWPRGSYLLSVHGAASVTLTKRIILQ